MIFLGGLEKIDCQSAACNIQGTTGDQVKSKEQPSALFYFYRSKSRGSLVMHIKMENEFAGKF